MLLQIEAIVQWIKYYETLDTKHKIFALKYLVQILISSFGSLSREYFSFSSILSVECCPFVVALRIKFVKKKTISSLFADNVRHIFFTIFSKFLILWNICDVWFNVATFTFWTMSLGNSTPTHRFVDEKKIGWANILKWEKKIKKKHETQRSKYDIETDELKWAEAKNRCLVR